MIGRLSIALLALIPGAIAVAQAPGSLAATGKALYAGRCASCHSAVAGEPSDIGPNLAGVAGRKAASLPGYDYSPALRKLGITWTAATLDRFLANPQATAPGTNMPIAVADPKARAAIVADLLTLKGKQQPR